MQVLLPHNWSILLSSPLLKAIDTLLSLSSTTPQLHRETETLGLKHVFSPFLFLNKKIHEEQNWYLILLQVEKQTGREPEGAEGMFLELVMFCFVMRVLLVTWRSSVSSNSFICICICIFFSIHGILFNKKFILYKFSLWKFWKKLMQNIGK